MWFLRIIFIDNTKSSSFGRIHELYWRRVLEVLEGFMNFSNRIYAVMIFLKLKL